MWCKFGKMLRENKLRSHHTKLKRRLLTRSAALLAFFQTFVVVAIAQASSEHELFAFTLVLVVIEALTFSFTGAFYCRQAAGI
jgi:hypothetical protein